MYLVGQAYYDEKTGERRIGRIDVAPKDNIFTIMARQRTVNWEYGVYEVVKVIRKHKHPIRIVEPCIRLKKDTYDALLAISEAQEYGDGRTLWEINSRLKLIPQTPTEGDNVCDILQVACRLLDNKCGQRAILQAVQESDALVS